MKQNYVKTVSFAALIITTAAFMFTSCASRQKELPADMTKLEIIQQAQNAYDRGNVKLAEKYYQTLLQRYGTDTAVYVEGRYEIAHLYLKQRRYTEAAAMYEEIISIYDNSTPGEIPGAYHKLAQNDLSKIPANKLPKKTVADSATTTTDTTEATAAAETTESANTDATAATETTESANTDATTAAEATESTSTEADNTTTTETTTSAQ